MDNAITLSTVLGDLGSLLMMIVRGFFAAEQPTLDLLIPAAIGYVVHRYIANKTAATVLIDMAGTAYNHMSAQFAANSTVSFAGARQAAIAAVVTGMDDTARAALSKMSQPQVAAGVDAKLGQLLASDPRFSVTDPLGKVALKTAIAAATAAAAAASIQQSAPAAVPGIQITDTPAATPADAAPAPGPSNFDITALVQDAVRQGMATALQNGMVAR